MKTQTIQRIAESVEQTRESLRTFDPAQHGEECYGPEQEYTADTLKEGIAQILLEISGLVGAHSKFVQFSTQSERNQMYSFLEQMNQALQGKNYSQLASDFDALKPIIRNFHTRGSSETQIALEKPALGISEVFGDKYGEKKRENVRFGWLTGAVALTCIGIGVSIWLMAELTLFNQTAFDRAGAQNILSRITIISMVFSGAWFCAGQYVKQRNIMEDYGYKAVLAKSMGAFLDTLPEGPARENYLEKVLSEMFKDPLRKQHDETVSVVRYAKELLRRNRKDTDKHEGKPNN